jgi:hypothetical protein
MLRPDPLSFLEVKRSFIRDRISTPKRGKSRKVDISLQLRDALKDQMKNVQLSDSDEASH